MKTVMIVYINGKKGVRHYSDLTVLKCSRIFPKLSGWVEYRIKLRTSMSGLSSDQN